VLVRFGDARTTHRQVPSRDAHQRGFLAAIVDLAQ